MSLHTRAIASSTLLLLSLTACIDQLPTTVGGDATRQSGVVTAVTDNPHVHLLPPLAPSANQAGVFDATLAPEVLVYSGTSTPCDVEAGAGCAALLAHFTMAGDGADRVRLDAVAEQYIVNWKPAKAPAAYRIAIRVGQQTLDNFDVAITKPGAVPVKFRIEQGAMRLSFAAVGASGGSVSAGGGTASLDIPAGALASATPITVEQLEPGPADARVVGDVFEFGPDGTTFATPVTITLAFDPAALPADVSPRRLRLHTFVNGAWRVIPGSSVDTTSHTVSGETAHFSTYAILPAAFSSVSSGEWHSCGLTSDGTAWCWGRNSSGQLGAVTTETCAGLSCSTTAVEVQGGLRFRSMEAGNSHSCGVTYSNEAFCWGLNNVGQLGDGTFAPSPVPVRAAPTLTFSSVSVDHQQSCGVTTAGEVHCWGANNWRQLGSSVLTTCGAQQCSPDPVRVAVPSASIVDVGLGHACALTTTGQMYCWGWNAFGQLGSGSATPQMAGPTLVPGGPYETISAGAVHNCMTRSGGVAVCFGRDYMPNGALGDGTKTTRLAPTPVAGGIAFAQVDASNGNYIMTHSCGVSTAGVAYCWGGNFDGQLGVETAPATCTGFGPFAVYDCALTPNPVSGGQLFSYITSSAGFNCGYTVQGDVYCWGKNTHGQLGNGTTTSTRVPVKVSTSGEAQ
ncbi:MAG TPA: hypothetical protein VFO55_03860 [Gemmatimonadaceae bacterium]|nr:hypothetical protein [Gemmatimonadaceae bacterium]